MRETRIFSPTPLSASSRIDLSAEAARHVSQVLRMQPGQELVLFDGSGGEYPASIETISRNKLSVTTHEHRATERESSLRLTLWHGLCRGERMDSVIQKATELGAHAIQPVVTQRSTVKIPADRAEKRLGHWRGIIVSACEQCGRNQLPSIKAPMAFADLLESVGSFDQALLLDPRGGENLATSLSRMPENGRLLICTGPEGGFSEPESIAAVSASMHLVHIGPRVLRTETAPVTALSIAQLIAGDLG